MTKVREDYENVVKENLRLSESLNNLTQKLDTVQKELNQELKANQKLKDRIKELEDQNQSQNSSTNQEIQDLKQANQDLTQQLED